MKHKIAVATSTIPLSRLDASSYRSQKDLHQADLLYFHRGLGERAAAKQNSPLMKVVRGETLCH